MKCWSLELCSLGGARNEGCNGFGVDSADRGAIFTFAAILSDFVGKTSQFVLIAGISIAKMDDSRSLFIDDASNDDLAFVEASKGEFGGFFGNGLVKVQFTFVVECLTELLYRFDKLSFFDHVIGEETLEGGSDHPIAFNEGPKQEAQEFEHVIVLVDANENVIARRRRRRRILGRL